jgi:transposase-like protein
MLSPKRDLIAAKAFLQLALCQAGEFRPRVINVDGHPAFEGALNTIAGYEAMNIIRKGQIRGLSKTDIIGQVRFIERMFGIAA